MSKDFDLAEFQAEVGAWHRHNFPAAPAERVALKLAEEVGELAHARIQLEDGIGDADKHRQEEADAVGDIMIVLAIYCEKADLDLSGCIIATWERVSKRDWQRDKLQGGKQHEGAE